MKSVGSWMIALAVMGVVLGAAVVPAWAGNSAGLFGGAEVAVLKPYYGSPSVYVPGTGEIEMIPTFDQEASPRLWLGYETCSGLAFKARYWQFDHDTSAGDRVQDVSYYLDLALKVETLDLELSQRGCFCNWELEVAGGVRWAQWEDEFTVMNDSYDSTELGRDFHGVGPTVAISARRPIGCTRLALIGSLRVSLLYGETTFELEDDLLGQQIDRYPNPLDGLTVEVDDHLTEIYEIRLGLEWSKCTCSGTRLYARAVLEAQAWELAPALLGVGDSNVGFVGPSFAIGFDR